MRRFGKSSISRDHVREQLVHGSCSISELCETHATPVSVVDRFQQLVAEGRFRFAHESVRFPATVVCWRTFSAMMAAVKPIVSRVERRLRW
jgi:hypothetical protein